VNPRPPVLRHTYRHHCPGAVDTVFISSVQRDYSDIRRAVARGVETLGSRPLMAEQARAAARSPKGALLDLVRSAEAMVLISVLGTATQPPWGRAPRIDPRRTLPHVGMHLDLSQACSRRLPSLSCRPTLSGGWHP
jgi:hypothetical protein